jgi:hypothetical protein
MSALEADGGDCKVMPMGNLAQILVALAVATSAIGFGCAVSRFLQICPNLGERGLLGLLCFGVCGCVLHFVTPITPTIHFAILAVGVGCLMWLWRDICSTLRPVEMGIALTVFLLVWLYPHEQHSYDEGLYYLQTLKWNTEMPITPGLGNLHGRLAFNSLLFLIAPVVDGIQPGGTPNLLVVAFVLIASFQRLRVAAAEPLIAAVNFWFLALITVAFVIRVTAIGWLGVLNADGFAAVLIVYWFSLAIELRTANSDRRETNLALMVLLAALACTVKISAAPLMLFALGFLVLQKPRSFPFRMRLYGFTATVFGTWFARGLVLSGCLIYPIPQSCDFHLPWAVLPEQVKLEMIWIRSWARSRGNLDYRHVLSSWTWLKPWLVQARFNFLMKLLALGATLGVAAEAYARFHLRSRLYVRVTVGQLFVCLAYWFFTAPEVRFGAGYLLAAGLLGVSMACAAVFHRPALAARVPLVLGIFMLLSGVRLLAQRSVLPPTSRPTTLMYRLRSPTGQGIWVPRSGDQCWDHPLPCTPNVNADAWGRVRWRISFPYQYDPSVAPPPDWLPGSAAD